MLNRVVDAALEATVALSFSRVGYAVRSRNESWREPSADPAKVFLVTGATSGLGQATAVELARTGGTVWLLGRSASKLATTCDLIGNIVPGARLRTITADLTSLSEVATVASQFTAERLDALIHNAGLMQQTLQYTADGIEATTQVHLVAPHRLTHDLRPVLRRTRGSRVVTVSSGGMYAQAVHLPDLEPTAASYNGTRQYARTKRAQVLMMHRWAAIEPEVAFHSMHPGWAATPGLDESLPAFAKTLRPLLRSELQGADTAIWLATTDQPLPNGAFWHDRRPRSTVRIPSTATSDYESTAIWNWVANHAGVSER